MKIFTKRFAVAIGVTGIVLILALLAQFTNEVNFGEAVAYGVILLVVLALYTLSQWLRTCTKTYRIAFGVGLLGAFLLFWVNGAVGIIGSENNPANLLFGTVFVVGLIGSLISRFKPRGMARTLLAAGIVQILVPVVALFIWPAQASWGDAGVIGVFIFNTIFAMLFLLSSLLFHRATFSNS